MMLHSVSWGAVFAGAVASLITQVILNMLGLGIGLSTVDPDGQRNAGGELSRHRCRPVVRGLRGPGCDRRRVSGGSSLGQTLVLDGRLSRPDRLGRIDPGDPLSPLLGR